MVVHMQHLNTSTAFTFYQESIDIGVFVDSTYTEQYEFISRGEFRDLHNCWPEDCKLPLTKVQRSNGDYISGVVVQSKERPRFEASRCGWAG